MAKPTYIIFRDQPYPDAYAQYVYDNLNMLTQSGLNTLDPADDIYSVRGFQWNVANNFYTNFPFGDGTISVEGYPMYVGGPLTGPGLDSTFGIDDHRLETYFFDGSTLSDSDFVSYSSVGNLISGRNVFVSHSGMNQSYPSSLPDTSWLYGTLWGGGGWTCCDWHNFPAFGWRQEFEYPQTWFSPFNQNWWNEDWINDVWPNIGFNGTSYSNFLVNEDPSRESTEDENDLARDAWQNYMLSLYDRYNDMDGSQANHYFYFVTDIFFTWTDWEQAGITNRTRGVYRYPLRLLVDAWTSGQPITTEVIMWRLYESGGDNWNDVMAANDGGCVNQVTEFGTSWAFDVYDDSDYGNSWSDVIDGAPSGCSNPAMDVGYRARPTLNLNITPPTIDIEAVPPYEPFYNMGGKTLEDIATETHVVFADSDLGGYNIYFNEEFPNFSSSTAFQANGVYSDWRPISNIFVGNDYLSGVYLQTYYGTNTDEYLGSSAPNIVNLYFSIQDGDNNPQIVDELFGQEYYQKIIEKYQAMGMGDMDVETLLSENNKYLSQNLKFFVMDWDWKEEDDDFLDVQFPYTDEEMIAYNYNDNTFIVQDAFTPDGSPNTLQHQYNSPGLKIIKAFVMSTVTNALGEEHVLVIKSLTVRIYLGLDDIYIEDFADIGGPDFTFIPWPYTSPIIGGIDDQSQYIKSLNKVVNNNLFDDSELVERNFARKALENQELGQSPGSLDIEQTRLFIDGSYDMAKLLGIEPFYENVDAGTYYTYYPYDKFEGTGRWDGINNKYPEETSVGSIFINDTLDLNLLSKCLFEFNFGASDGRTVRDSSGNGNKGIFIGDFKVAKESKDSPLRRDSVMDTPSTDTKNGAI